VYVGNYVPFNNIKGNLFVFISFSSPFRCFGVSILLRVRSTYVFEEITEDRYPKDTYPEVGETKGLSDRAYGWNDDCHSYRASWKERLKVSPTVGDRYPSDT
jgi:hypothetical protein